MAPKNIRFFLPMLVLCFATVAVVPAFAGSSIVGSLAGSANATIGGQPAINGSTIFSGDSLKVTDGVALVALGEGSRAMFGRNSEVSFLREGESVTARLSRGTASIFQSAKEKNGMRMKFDNVTIGPAGGYKTLGEVAMLGSTVIIRTKEGMMNVSFANGGTTQVPAGKILRLTPTQRAPQEAAGSQHFGAGLTWVDWTAFAAAGAAAILAGVDISKSSNAQNAASSAEAEAGDAANAASAAAAAASAASVAAASAQMAAECAADQAALAASPSTPGGAILPYTPLSSVCPAPSGT